MFSEFRNLESDVASWKMLRFPLSFGGNTRSVEENNRVPIF